MENFESKLTEYQNNQINDLLDEFKQTLASGFPSISNTDIYLNKANLVRFAIAHNFDSPTIRSKWKKWVEWHSKYQPDKLTEDDPVISTLHNAGFLRWYKCDKEKRPCLYYKAKNHIADSSTYDELFRYVVYMVEEGLREATLYDTDQIVVIYDRRGFSKRNQDSKYYERLKELSLALQDYYPERLFGLYYLGTRLFAQVMAEKGKTFLSERTRNKFRVLFDPQGLLEFFDRENLTVEYSGVPESRKLGQELDRKLVNQHGGDDAVNSEDEEDDYEQLEDAMLSKLDNSKLQTESGNT